MAECATAGGDGLVPDTEMTTSVPTAHPVVAEAEEENDLPEEDRYEAGLVAAGEPAADTDQLPQEAVVNPRPISEDAPPSQIMDTETKEAPINEQKPEQMQVDEPNDDPSPQTANQVRLFPSLFAYPWSHWISATW